MTISTTATRISYNGNGATTAFSFPYRFLANADLIVIKVAADGTETNLVLNTDYTVTGADQDAGGTVTLGTAPASGVRVVIYREIDITQEVDYIAGDAFPAETHERALDRLTMIAQQHEDAIGRSARLPITSTISTDQLVADILKIADRATALDTVANSIADVTATAAHMAEIIAAPAYAASVAADAASATAAKNAAESSATAASGSATAASNSAIDAAAAAVIAANAVSAANIPPSLAGQANKFLQVKDDETGYELVSSVAAPAFYGFKLSDDLSSLNMIYGRDDYNVEDFATWTMSENVTFRIRNNNLEMVL